MRLGVVSRLSLSRKGLCALLASSKSCSIVLELAGIPEDVDILRKAQPEVLLLHASGEPAEFENVSRLRNLLPEIKVLFFLDAADDEIEIQAIRAGGRGCVTNASDLETLVKALGAVAQGEIWVSRRVASQLITKLLESEAPDGSASSGLTPQEWRVLALLASGSRNKEIAKFPPLRFREHGQDSPLHHLPEDQRGLPAGRHALLFRARQAQPEPFAESAIAAIEIETK